MDKEKVIAKLKEVIDPELGINVYDLGLIYEINQGEKELVSITMTLTTPGCPLHDSITSGVRYALLSLPEIKDVEVNLVWNPPWNPDMMSDIAKTQLGH